MMRPASAMFAVVLAMAVFATAGAADRRWQEAQPYEREAPTRYNPWSYGPDRSTAAPPVGRYRDDLGQNTWSNLAAPEQESQPPDTGEWRPRERRRTEPGGLREEQSQPDYPAVPYGPPAGNVGSVYGGTTWTYPYGGYPYQGLLPYSGLYGGSSWPWVWNW